MFQFRFYELKILLQRRSVKILLLLLIMLIAVYLIIPLHDPDADTGGGLVDFERKRRDYGIEFPKRDPKEEMEELEKETLQYAVMIDAGSSGSRVYIYVWPPHSGDTRQLLKIRLLRDQSGHDLYRTIKPGLSSCAENVSRSFEYVAPLLDFAAKHIPVVKHKETPVYLLATAGMRLLDQITREAILENVRAGIPRNYSFLFTPNNVQVISGKDEGIYSWIALNYLAGRFDHTFEKNPLTVIEDGKKRWTRMRTVSMMEMGGASIQIAFEITSNAQYEQLKKSQKVTGTNDGRLTEINLGCTEHDTNHKYRLFVATFLTLGANAAREHYVHYLIEISGASAQFVNSSLTTRETMLYDPCLSIDSSETVNVTDPAGSNTKYLYHLKGSGDYGLCVEKQKQIITRDALRWCMNETCPFDELKKITVPFKETEFYGLSEFWYSMNDLFRMGGPYRFKDFAQASAKYCSTSWLVTQDRFKRNLYPNADFKRLLYQCFKSAWMTAILHDGFHMPKQYDRFRSVSMIRQEPVQWTLGALILRTRFFPLRAIDTPNGVAVVRHGIDHPTNQHVQYAVFFLCMLAVVSAIVIYLRRLHLMLNHPSGHGGCGRYFDYPKQAIIEARPLCGEEEDVDQHHYHQHRPHHHNHHQRSVFIQF